MRVVGLTVLALIAVGGTAHAQRFANISGGQLGNLCVSQSRAQTETCNAYLDGVSDSISFYQRLLPADGSKGGKLPDYTCVPGPTTGPQLRESYVAWLRKHADAQRQPAGEAAMRALHDSYLCEGAQGRAP
jgi:hypothetical protein